jgi:hypothetical protein
MLCERTSKKCFGEKKAKRIADIHTAQNKDRLLDNPKMRAYPCSFCGCWHVGHKHSRVGNSSGVPWQDGTEKGMT